MCYAMEGSPFCYFHDPNIRETFLATSRRGGLKRKNGELEEGTQEPQIDLQPKRADVVGKRGDGVSPSLLSLIEEYEGSDIHNLRNLAFDTIEHIQKGEISCSRARTISDMIRTILSIFDHAKREHVEVSVVITQVAMIMTEFIEDESKLREFGRRLGEIQVYNRRQLTGSRADYQAQKVGGDGNQ
jgi:hypothetical protein